MSVEFVSDGGGSPKEFLEKLKAARDNIKTAGGGAAALTGPALERIIRELERLQRAEKFLGKMT